MQPSHANPIPAPQLLSALNWRYATKVFDPERKIPTESWSTLEQALVLSPSSFGLQPYRFLVINDANLRQRLLPHSWNQRQVVDASHLVVFAARTELTAEEVEAFLELTAVTRGVSVESLSGFRSMLDGTVLKDSFKPRVLHWATCQAYIALGQLMTGAAVLGIDTCPLEGFVPAEYDTLLGLASEGLNSVVCCALGYRAATDKYASLPKVRFDPKQLILHR